jgi:hypothetical protein
MIANVRCAPRRAVEVFVVKRVSLIVGLLGLSRRRITIRQIAKLEQQSLSTQKTNGYEHRPSDP